MKGLAAVWIVLIIASGCHGRPEPLSKLTEFIGEYERGNANKEKLTFRNNSTDDIVTSPSHTAAHYQVASHKISTGDPDIVDEESDADVYYYDQNLHLVHDFAETRKLFGGKDDTLQICLDPNYKLDAKELERLSTKFETNIKDLPIDDWPTIIKKADSKVKSKMILSYVRSELALRKEIFKGVVDATDLSSWKGNPAIKETMEKIFGFMKHHDAVKEEKARFKRLLHVLENNPLTETEKIVINTYSRSPEVNAYLIDLDINEGKVYAKGESKIRSILKVQAKLLQNALKKLERYEADLLIRVDTNWKKNGDGPFDENEPVIFNKFTSTMDVSDLKKNLVEGEIHSIGIMKKQPRLLIRFEQSKKGYEISPWVKTQYLSQREVLLPIGAAFTTEAKDPKVVDPNDRYKMKYTGYRYVYEFKDIIGGF